MVTIGNFLYKYRNFLFIFLYLMLFIPSPPIFDAKRLGSNYYYWPLAIGLTITILGQLIRGATIGLAYIIRGGKDGKVYADDLVTTGIFNHCRNPLYVGNILMLLGAGILANSLFYLAVVIPFFLFTYQAIVLAEEHFLRNKFGIVFDNYCNHVNRWFPSTKGLSATFRSMTFRWKRWLTKEYNTQFVWLTGITLITLFTYPELTDYDSSIRNLLLAIILPVILAYYLLIRYLKKSGKWSHQ
ncbi:MAG: S-isoprenylcysteine methyltransferase [Citrobacter freundii]|nr:MAG: S-isoprenylcysteine methyltransferase [Citrobacter freundii]